jgi:heme-degrading monooxygenase HmoA
MIVRSWTGWTEKAKAAEYEAYMHEVALDGYTDIPGNRGVLMLRRDEGDRSEFTMISLWNSLDDIQAFAGDDPTTAVFYDRDEELLVERDLTVKHYDVYGATPTFGPPVANSANPGQAPA